MPEKDNKTLALPETVENLKAPDQTSNVRDEIETVLDEDTDYYLLRPPRQPKAEVAAYVESQGIAVPRRFVSLQEALDSGRSFIVRSEHPDEYTGLSGLLQSAKVTPQAVAEIKELMDEKPEFFLKEDELKNGFFTSMFYYPMLIIRYLKDGSQKKFEAELTALRKKKIENYCKFRKMPEKEFIQNISYSYWELLGGINRTVVADDAVEGRYHFFSVKENSICQDYSIYDNGQLISMTPWMSESTRADLNEIAAFYEKIRRLPRFQARHCPVMEIQTVDEHKNFFLQCHRMHNLNPARFCLERPCAEGEIEAFFVRGATPPEGIMLPAIICGDEENTEGVHFCRPYHHDIDVYDTKMQAFLIQKETSKDFVGTIGTRHIKVLKLFSPGISVVADAKTLGIDFREAEAEFNKSRKPVIIPIRVVSDGRRAYLKVIRSS